jgi:transcriptional regulator with XRE-family HTH domain
MTPFGERVRALRRAHGVTLKKMAADLQISEAYLSALEHGRRGRPTQNLVRQICGYFNIIWDDAEALENLARLSHPRAVVDTAGLSPKATELANRLAEEIGALDDDALDAMLGALDTARQTGAKE